MNTIKKILKNILPKNIFSIYHFVLAFLANIIFGKPSKDMIVIGVTGTKGKTTTSNFIWRVLQSGGFKTGLLTTANIRIGEKEILNPFHMTMPGRFAVQKFLKQMKDEGCKIVIVETTSQGLIQFRHIGIQYDIAVFTNLTPEHIDAHKTFENYKKAKGILFSYLTKFKNKKIDGKEIQKMIVANLDSEHAPYYLSFPASKKITFGVENKADFSGKVLREDDSSISVSINDNKIDVPIVGGFNLYNILPAFAIARFLDISVEKIREGLLSMNTIPGRMEKIPNNLGISLFVDYAHEKESTTHVLQTGRILAGENKLIVLLGAEGGGRDKGKRPIMGEISGRLADVVVVSNVDPYEDDPLPIAEDIANASEKTGKERGKNLFVILDRREGIKKALEVSNKGDVVFITGKGAEQSMIINGVSIPWDDRVVVKEELEKLNG